ncbi:hypothetical protein HIM_05086 [Hirsutella minnesotensis 3608]|uniref:Uncharacterized protein n=1 Tax=Hirsutella minnesotensis 3608 TaxID=1043627 RepID=A0A0F7ZUX5_9HYPO|nr:hypothetical protein HIM_05086 [Hirsutella minnesotensis 3608]
MDASICSLARSPPNFAAVQRLSGIQRSNRSSSHTGAFQGPSNRLILINGDQDIPKSDWPPVANDGIPGVSRRTTSPDLRHDAEISRNDVPSCVQSPSTTSSSPTPYMLPTRSANCSQRSPLLERAEKHRQSESAAPETQDSRPHHSRQDSGLSRLGTPYSAARYSFDHRTLTICPDDCSDKGLHAQKDQYPWKPKYNSLDRPGNRFKLQSVRAPSGHRSIFRGKRQAQTGSHRIKEIHRKRGKPGVLYKSDDDLESSTWSTSLPSQANLTSPTSSSEEESIAYRSSRVFPPQFPAPPGKLTLERKNRSIATGRIATWISQRECSQNTERPGNRVVGFEPSRRGRDSSNDTSASSEVSSYAEIEYLWQQIKDKRSKLSDVRQKMTKWRQELRSLRQRQQQADNAFMTLVRPMVVENRSWASGQVEALDCRVAAMQDLRDTYRSREMVYEAHERMVDEDEKQLALLETRFFGLLAAGPSQIPHASALPRKDPETKIYSPTDIPYELRGIQSVKPCEDLHPTYVRLTSAVGDLENAKEEYHDLLMLKEQYEHDLEIHKSTGKRAMTEAEDFLSEFPIEEARMRHNVSRLQQQVWYLADLCKAKRTMRKYLSVQMAYALNPRSRLDDFTLEDRMTILTERKSLAHNVFTEILSQPDHLLLDPHPLTSLQALKIASQLDYNKAESREKQRLAAKEFSIDALLTGSGPGTKGDFVNRWLLQQLRQSPLNVQLLHSTFTWNCSLRIRDIGQWQRDVMHYWWRDGTMDSRQIQTKVPPSLESGAPFVL